MSEPSAKYSKLWESTAVSIVVLALAGLTFLVLFFFMKVVGTDDTGRADFTVEDPLEILPQQGRPIPPLDIAAALKTTKEQLTKGRAIYKVQCASCHGAEGLGNGPAGTGLNPPPRNFAAKEGWKKGYKIVNLFETLTEGLGSMPAFDYLAPQDRFALAHYVQELGKFDHGPEPDDAVKELDGKYHLQEGGREPNKIALSVAIDRMLGERLRPVLSMPASADRSPQAVLLRRVVDNPRRVARVLAGLPSWRKDADALARAAAVGAPGNGFAPAVAALTPAQTQQLHAGLLKHYQDFADLKRAGAPSPSNDAATKESAPAQLRKSPSGKAGGSAKTPKQGTKP